MMDLNFKKITIEDKEIFDRIFNIYQPKNSEYNFSTLFTWQEQRNIMYASYKDGIILKGTYKNEDYFSLPIGYTNCEEILNFIIDYGIKNNIKSIRLITENYLKYFKKNKIKIFEDRNNFDYVYKTESLATLKGWRLDSKRAFIKKFKNLYNYQYAKYRNEFKNDCLKLLEKWANNKIENDNTVIEEIIALKKVLDYNDILKLDGGVLFVNNTLIAFTFGEKLNNTTYVVHYEKADTDYIGSYQMINNLFVINEIYGKYKFVNREQDMGIEGIRKAKLSYHPYRFIKKYVALI